jgi:tetratricopeptide (TPR) repeat protein
MDRSPVDEPAHWYERAFAAAGNASELALARATFGAAHVADSRGDLELAKRQFEEASDRLGELGQTRWWILALSRLAGANVALGDSARGEELYQGALKIALECGDTRGAAVVRSNLARDLRDEGNDEWARRLDERPSRVGSPQVSASRTDSCSTRPLGAGSTRR